jgi:signal transduction histidine kinase
MLLEFIRENRAELIRRTREKVRSRASPRATPDEIESGVPLFLTQFTELLSSTHRELALPSAPPATPAIRTSATVHGNELLRRGFTIAQVVHDYGDICQATTELAGIQKKEFSTNEFHILNLCLDNAIAEAVTEYSRQREQNLAGEEAERLGFLAHELRNLMSTATLAFQVLRGGTVAVGGSTGAVLDRSLTSLNALVERSLAEVRLASQQHRRTRFPLAELIAEVEVSAALEANGRKVELKVAPVESDISIEGDRQLLAAAVSNLLQNAFKFTQVGGHISLRAHKKADRAFIEVEDECGGLPPGKAEALFHPFERRGSDKTGLGLGLAISRKSVTANGGNIHVVNMPGKGCVFTIELPVASQGRA